VVAASGLRRASSAFCRYAGHRGPSAIKRPRSSNSCTAPRLIHDDVIDTLIRAPSSFYNSRWGNQPSVLAGDWLYCSRSNGFGRANFRILTCVNLTQKSWKASCCKLRIGRRDVTEDDALQLATYKTRVCSWMRSWVRF